VRSTLLWCILHMGGFGVVLDRLLDFAPGCVQPVHMAKAHQGVLITKRLIKVVSAHVVKDLGC
jgi:hypothetical protein